MDIYFGLKYIKAVHLYNNLEKLAKLQEIIKRSILEKGYQAAVEDPEVMQAIRTYNMLVNNIIPGSVEELQNYHTLITKLNIWKEENEKLTEKVQILEANLYSLESRILEKIKEVNNDSLHKDIIDIIEKVHQHF